MENPASWGKAERIVDKVIRDHRDRTDFVVGLSLTRRITDALRREGLLKDE